MHTPRTSALDISPSKIIEELNKLPPFDADESERPQHKTGNIEELKKQLFASMHNAAFKATQKP